MANFSQAPIYNLSVVLKNTGFKADVLRAWERRYDLPKPQRTPGGHRLYSEYDIETVKWLKARQAEGLSISRAVDLWRGIVNAGRDPLEEALLPNITVDARIEILRSEWLAACMIYDGSKVEEVLNQAFAIYPVETVCTAILQQGLSEIGDNWMAGKITAQQEHFASALAVRRIETLITATPPPTRPQTVLVACPSGEWHTFSSLLMSLLLRRKGWRVVYLGGNTPIEQMEETASAVQPDLIILSAQQLTTAATLRSAAFCFQSQTIPLAYGGLIFNRIPRLRQRIPGHFLGESLDEALARIESFLAAPHALRLDIQMNDPYLGFPDLFREKRPLIDHAIYQIYKESGEMTPHIQDAISYMGNGVSAALELGDLTFLDADLDWLRMLLAGRKISTGPLISFFETYDTAVHLVLGDAGSLITAWLAAHTAQNEEPDS